VLLDDVGFGASSTFGGPVNTPTFEALAKRGLRYNQFHTTALCSPTRAALITGRNHHSVHSGAIGEMATGYPGYDSLMGPDTATVAEILKQHGWNTAWFGKNHNVSDWESSQSGPFDRWPTSLGFEKFYGFLGGEMNQWRPFIFDGTNPIEPYVGKADYNLDYDLADQAIKYIRNHESVSPDKPFFVYYAPGATHTPHHPRPEWIAKYKGKFDIGWDAIREQTLARQKQLGVVPQDAVLTARPPGVKPWDSLTADEKKLFAHMMEVYAGYLEQTDYNAGRVIQAIDDLGLTNNTLVFYICGDNGASAEGGLTGSVNADAELNRPPLTVQQMMPYINDLGSVKTYPHYPVGWAIAMDTPFQWAKQVASHYGGTRNAMVISWPGHITDVGGLRSQWHHIIDITPTILDAVHVPQPTMVNGATQRPMEGVSMVYTLAGKELPSTHKTQYFEIVGYRAIYSDGWIACTTPPLPPWDLQAAKPPDVISGYKWELYQVEKDFSEGHDLAAQMPDKLAALQKLFDAEAAKYHVFPLDNDKVTRADPKNRPSLTGSRTSFAYYQGERRIPEPAAADTKNRSWRLTADVDIPAGGAEGVIATLGGLSNGWALYLRKGKPVFHYTFGFIEHYNIEGQQPLTPGHHTVVFDFQYDGGGIGKGATGVLSVDGQQAATGRIEHTVGIRYTLNVESFDVGEDTGTPVNASYDVPFAFSGTIQKVAIDLKALDKASAEAVAQAERQWAATVLKRE
jgi:arylsulfatase